MITNPFLEEKLREAVCFGNLKLIKELVLMGVNVNSKNKVNGWTALHWAAYRNNIDAVAILINHGADVNVLNFKGEPPHSLSTNSDIQVSLGGPISDRKLPELPIVPNYLRTLQVCSLSDYGNNVVHQNVP